MTGVDDIKNIIVSIQNRREQWRLSTRQKNLLTWKNYISGPIADNHQPPVPSDVWVFGLDINGLSCYLKFQDRPSGVVIWISLHEAEYPLYFTYR